MSYPYMEVIRSSVARCQTCHNLYRCDVDEPIRTCPACPVRVRVKAWRKPNEDHADAEIQMQRIEAAYLRKASRRSMPRQIAFPHRPALASVP